jgi:hypothetical protein
MRPLATSNGFVAEPFAEGAVAELSDGDGDEGAEGVVGVGAGEQAFVDVLLHGEVPAEVEHLHAGAGDEHGHISGTTFGSRPSISSGADMGSILSMPARNGYRNFSRINAKVITSTPTARADMASP